MILGRTAPLVLLCLGALGTLPASADLSKYAGCADLRTADFTFTPLVNNATNPAIREPMKMAFDMDAAGNVDVYFVLRGGTVMRYNAVSKTTSTLANLGFSATQVPPPPNRNSFGLIGIALDPGFKTNRWMYLYTGLEREWKISRYVVNGSQVDLASEKVIFRFDPGTTALGLTHIAGAIRFDHEGNLWATVSDNENRFQSANTNSYLGKIIRIRPKAIPDAGTAPAPGAGSTYDIPAGNLYPENTAKVKPEIYIMGARNPYTLALDPVRKAVAWGDVGPDGITSAKGTEEFNFATAPGNYGYPFWAGDQTVLDPGHGSTSAPTNERPDNTGLTTLKPAIPATIPYQQACAITGPVYWYNGTLNTKGKWPPHLNGAWIVAEFEQNWIHAVELDAAGKVLSRLPLFAANAGGHLDEPIEVQMGPDGVLYIVNYSGYRTWTTKTGLLKVEYNGACAPTSTAPRVELANAGARLEGRWLAIDQAGTHEVAVFDAKGTVEYRRRGDGPARYDVQAYIGKDLRFVRVKTASGQVVQTLFRAPLEN